LTTIPALIFLFGRKREEGVNAESLHWGQR
jgi:hypothetical protein